MTGSVEASGGRPEQIGPDDSVPVHLEELIASLNRTRVYFSDEKKKTLRARYAYGTIFLAINLCAWFVRDYGPRVFSDLPYIKACGEDGRDCFHTLGVLRVSLGCFVFFLVMFVTTWNTTKLDERRNTWHSGFWTLKFFMLIPFLVAPFFLPPIYIQFYGEIARVGAGIFLALQLVSVIEFVAWWDSYWMPDEETKQRSCSFGLFMSTIFYVGSACGIALMYHIYAASTSCFLNIFFVTWTVVLLIVMLSLSLNSKINRGLLSSGIMASYVVFLCWSALRSEPSNEKCNANKQSGHGDWTTVLSFLMAICAVVMSTFSTGIDSQSFQFRKEEIKEEEDTPYDYGFFHLVFSLGAMYFAMLFISWNLENSSTTKWSVDVGWGSTWVKIVNEWFAATIYMWKLIAPVVRQRPKVHEANVEQTHEPTLP